MIEEIKLIKQGQHDPRNRRAENYSTVQLLGRHIMVRKRLSLDLLRGDSTFWQDLYLLLDKMDLHNCTRPFRDWVPYMCRDTKFEGSYFWKSNCGPWIGRTITWRSIGACK